jgi:hypothetical protein
MDKDGVLSVGDLEEDEEDEEEGDEVDLTIQCIL